MSSKIRNCVKGLRQNKDSKELLPEYVSQYMMLNESYARMELMIEYYLFYEVISEGINPYIDSAKDIVQKLHEYIEIIYEKEPSLEEKQEMAQKLLELRNQVVDRMQVLTAYVDCFVVYEYILNRVQYRFEDMEMLPQDSVFAQDLVNFIFSSQDNAAISDNIRFAIGQLPMRITRSRFFDMIKESMSIYKGSDVSSLESFVYMFRTNAMLYKDENMKEYFTEFVPLLEELASLDYDQINEETYRIYAEKIRTNASKLNDISDLYLQIGKLVNELYCICGAGEYGSRLQEKDAFGVVVRGINALFLQKESNVWQQATEPLETEEEKIAWLEEHFPSIEGRQEQVYDSMNMAGAVLEETWESQKDTIEQLGLTKDFIVLRRMFLLHSNSVFADLEEESIEEKVTEERIEKESARLIQECKELFQGKSRMLRRAVMANTLEKMPVVFTSAQEVADYITNSLGQCDDVAEKYAAKQLLMDIMH